jgi:bidirectional [NiFe] hydrogenase diaphorase subunit
MNLEELQQLQEQEQAAAAKCRHRLCVCVGTGCLAAQSDQVKNALTAEVKARGKEQEIAVVGVGCPGFCAQGPLVNVQPANLLYGHVTAANATAILDSLATGPTNGQITDHTNQETPERLNARTPERPTPNTLSALLCPTDTPLFTRQRKIVLENAGRIDPERIEPYIAVGGYQSLLNALTEMTPAQVLEVITRSGLRGRGGGGYPTGLKWNTVAKAHGSQKYVICNGDEGDPGAFMDRAVMEGDPHRVLEGMALAAYAVGASKGYLYIRAEYPLAVKRIKTAINRAERHGLLGQNIADTSFDFHVEVRLGAGAFVCGEETALISSIAGNRGTPRPRPPYPAQTGLWGCPTLINNVETYANVPPILRQGAEWYADIGTAKSKGTKVFCLTGAILHTGLIEVPMGITLRDIVYEIGGGIPGDRAFKAVQTGGPSGGCIPAQFLDRPVDYESLKEVGSIMGSGGMIVMDETSCMVDVAKFFMEFCKTESCGKCVPCRVGTAQMYDLLDRMTRGKADMHDLELLEELCGMVSETSLCGLGQSAPNPVISTMRYFRDEYLAHIVDKRCPAGVCPIGGRAQEHTAQAGENATEGALSHA